MPIRSRHRTKRRTRRTQSDMMYAAPHILSSGWCRQSDSNKVLDEVPQVAGGVSILEPRIDVH